ncbi:MAG: uracil-DNA glycosylase [Planctomycetota bacterium]|nr:MAG: uracil-DNA glycosylase [Planctomycetota bacterium]
MSGTSDTTDPPEASPEAELRALVRATRAAVRRRTSFGLRRGARPVESVPPEPVPEPRREPAAGTRGPSPAPGPAPARAMETTLASPPGSAGGEQSDPAVRELRARAAAAGDLASLRAAVAGCEACELCKTRTQTVFADGTGASGVMFVGEAPGYHEDQQGVPFVGPAGGLLTDIIVKGMGLRRADVVICNVLKCRPPDNRDPSPAEKRLCTGWLDRQIELADPKILIALGRHAAGHLLGSDASMGQMRGRVHHRAGRPVVATYHPAFLLRSPHMKQACWEDIQLAMRTAGIPLPGRG